MWRVWLAGAAGAALVYFFDPDRGRRRRNMARDRIVAAFRGQYNRAERLRRAASAEAYGLKQKVTHPRAEDEAPPNDATLTQRVESEVFRDPNIPKGRVNINAEEGVIVLRGELDRPDQIQAIEAAVRKVPGVLDVRNLLHLPTTATP
jgi:osmotically-inducible protein OsmY